MKVQLTDRFCQHAKSTAAQTDYFDETVPGLALRVTAHGTKAWTFLYGSPRRRVTLGRYPAISLAGARTAAIRPLHCGNERQTIRQADRAAAAAGCSAPNLLAAPSRPAPSPQHPRATTPSPAHPRSPGD